MTPRGRRAAIRTENVERLTTLARTMRSVVSHGGAAIEDQIVSDLGDVSREAVSRTLASLVDVGYLEVNGERRGWARRTYPLHRITDKGRAALDHLLKGTTP